MRSASAKPRVVTKRVRSPLRSSSALVATVVPMRTTSMSSAGSGADGREPEQVANALDRRVVVARAFRKQLVSEEGAVGASRHDVREGPAAIDPELPCHRRSLMGTFLIS